MANPFTTAQAPQGMNMIAPDLTVQQTQLMRQQRIADMLREQSMQPMGDTQTIGGWAIKKSPLEGLSKIAQALGANYSQGKIDDQQLALGKALQERMGAGFDSMLGGGGQSPNQEQPTQPGLSASSAEGFGLPVSAATPEVSQQAPQPDQLSRLRSSAKAALLMGNTDLANKLIGNMLEMTSEQKNNNYMGITPDQAKQFELARRTKEGTQSFQPGQMNQLPNGQRVVAPNFETGVAGGFDSTGAPVAMEIPGSAGIAANRASAVTSATKAAEQPFQVPTVVDTKPEPRLMTPRQQIDAANGLNVPPSVQATRDSAAGKLMVNEAGGTENAAINLAQLDKELSNKNLSSDARGILQGERNRIAAGVSLPGLPLQSAFAKKTAEMDASNMAGYSKALDDRVQTGSDLNMRLQEQFKALQEFKAGGGTETRAKMASMVQAMGLPDTIVNKIAGGDLAAEQVFKKNAAQTAMEQLKQAMGGSGRITQAEFKVFQDNNPNLSTDPNAIKKIFDFGTKVYNRDLQEQQAYQDYKQKNPNNTAGFGAYWSKQNQERGFTNPNMNAQSGKTFDSLPNPAQFNGKRMKAPDGTIIKSNGKMWVKE